MPKSQEMYTQTQLLAIVWVLSGIALAFLTARLLIRLKVYSRLMVDDGLVILAWICLLVSDIINTIILSRTYIIQNVEIDHFPEPSHYQAVADSYAKYQWADAYLFFTGIWAVKGSFLAYYDHLTKRLPRFRRAWWATITLTVLTYIGNLFAYAFLDGISFTMSLKNEAFKYQFAADLATDVFITIIPLTLALKAQISTKEKTTLAGVFSLSLVVTIFAIVRFVLNSPNRGTAPPSQLQVWSTIEQSVSISVACVASFRVFVIDRRRRSERSSWHGRANSMSGPSLEKNGAAFIKGGLSDLRPHWGISGNEPKDGGYMELQRLDTSLSKTRTPTAKNGDGGDNSNTI